MKTDRVYCPSCGEEYNRLIGHQCDPRLLNSIDLATKADAEVRWGGSRQGAGRPPVNFKIPDLDADIARWFGNLSNEAKAGIVTKAYQENDQN